MLGRLLSGLGLRPKADNVRELAVAAQGAFDRRNFAQAAALYERVVSVTSDPSSAVNLGYARLELGDSEAARAAFDLALQTKHGFAPAHVGLGDAAARIGDHGAAVGHYRDALHAEPQSTEAHNNLSLSLTALGDLEGAWGEGEWRWTLPDTRFLYPHRRPEPRWDGSPLCDRQLLVHWEQAFGDVIQNLRFAPLVEPRAPNWRFESPPPLARLAARGLGSGRVVPATPPRAVPPAYDFHVPLASLPHVLGLSSRDIPAPPYLSADNAAASELRASWGGQAARLVGIVWRSSKFDPARDLPLADVLRIAALPDVRLVSLQKDTTAEERSQLAAHGAIDAGIRFRDFADTADAIAALDTVVTVDTSVAHVAGALDARTVLLLNEPAAVRWMQDRDTSPWYPSMRLVRRRPGEPWSALVAKTTALLVH